MPEAFQLAGAEHIPLVRVHRANPGSGVCQCNRELALGFGTGANAVIVVDERIRVDDHVLLGIFSQADPAGAKPEVIWAAITGAVRADRPAAYVAGHYWSMADLCWMREVGYMWIAHDRVPCQESSNLPCLWLAVISKAAWARVGPFDPAFGTHADVDWALRARQAGVRFRFVATQEVKLDGLPLLPAGAYPSVDAAMTLRLVRKHGRRGSWLAVATRRVGRCLAAEARKVRFRADYGQPIGTLRRLYWYLRALAAVVKRPALRLEVMAVVESLAPIPRAQHQDD